MNQLIPLILDNQKPIPLNVIPDLVNERIKGLEVISSLKNLLLFVSNLEWLIFPFSGFKPLEERLDGKCLGYHF